MLPYTNRKEAQCQSCISSLVTTCVTLLKGFLMYCRLFGSLLIFFDALTTKGFYDAAVEKSKTNNPFNICFMYGPPNQNSPNSPNQNQYNFHCDGEYIHESAFFFASASSMLLPIPIGMIIGMIYMMYKYITDMRSTVNRNVKACKGCCDCFLLVVVGPFTIIPAILASLLIPLAWIISPFLHFIQALFSLLGARPQSNNYPIQVKLQTFHKSLQRRIILKLSGPNVHQVLVVCESFKSTGANLRSCSTGAHQWLLSVH